MAKAMRKKHAMRLAREWHSHGAPGVTDAATTQALNKQPRTPTAALQMVCDTWLQVKVVIGGLDKDHLSFPSTGSLCINSNAGTLCMKIPFSEEDLQNVTSTSLAARYGNLGPPANSPITW